MSVGVDGLGDSIAPEETTSDEETDSCVVNDAGANVILELLLFTSKLEEPLSKVAFKLQPFIDGDELAAEFKNEVDKDVLETIRTGD